MSEPAAPASDAQPVTAYIGLGANLGDGAACLQWAAARLAQAAGAQGTQGSRIYRSAPVDSAGPTYWNAVLALPTAHSPEALLHLLQQLEQAAGRERPYRNAPRTLDLDLLLQGEAVRTNPNLTVPHPRLHQRAFVLVPLLELAPHLTVPGLGALADHLPAVAQQAITPTPQRVWPAHGA